MMSSRWRYEKNQETTLGGRFFNPDSPIPAYKDIQDLTAEFREWLISRAKILPEEMIIDVTLQYGNNTMSSIDKCVKLIPAKDSPKRISQHEMEQAERKIKKCEDQNRNMKQILKTCENAQKELEQAKQKLTQAKADGCVSSSETASAEKSGSGPCKFPENMTMASIRTELSNCMTTACGTPSAGTDMIAYQKCVQAVSEQFQNEIRRQMGQAPNKQSPANEDSCQAAEKEIQTIEQNLTQYRCDLISQMPKQKDCSSLAVPMQPDDLNIEKNRFIPPGQLLKRGFNIQSKIQVRFRTFTWQPILYQRISQFYIVSG